MGYLSKLWTWTDSLWNPKKPLVLTKDMEVKTKKKTDDIDIINQGKKIPQLKKRNCYD